MSSPSLLFKSFYQNYIVNGKKQHDIIYRRLYSIYGSLLKKNGVRVNTMDLSQYLGHILVETVKPFFLLLILQIPVGLDSESSYGFDFGYKILQCS